MAKPCRCGLDPKGPVCAHCDAPAYDGEGPLNCARCARLARMCAVCRKIYDKPSQRADCESQHIIRELQT